MSRTKRGSKGGGYEYWGTRGNALQGQPSFRGNKLNSDKRRTHRIERQEGKRQTRNEE